MNPGKSPIFITDLGVQTNVPPAGNLPWTKPPVWQLAQHVDEDPVPVALRNQGNP